MKTIKTYKIGNEELELKKEYNKFKIFWNNEQQVITFNEDKALEIWEEMCAEAETEAGYEF